MTAGGWLVPIVALRRHLGDRRREQRQGSLGELRVADVVVPADHDVAVDVVLTAVDGGIEVAGTVTAAWQAECRRCLRPVTGVLTAEVRELYRPPDRHVADPRHRDEEEDEDDTYELGAERLDLAPLARDAVLLGLPLAPLCRPDCAGLCPGCGAELADGDCGCAPPPPDPRWAALDALAEPGVASGAPRGGPARATRDGGSA